MQYMLLIYGDESAQAAASPEEQNAVFQAYWQYGEWLNEKGWNAGGDPLRDTSHATVVRVRDGERIVTDGPFAETKEQLGGYYIVDVPNLDDAIEAAERCPGAEHGTMEVRPVLPMDELTGHNQG